MQLRPNYEKRIFGLDVYRAVAILLVVHGHGRWMLADSFLEGFPWFKVSDGVELFFVLSGFLIGRILLNIVHRSDYRLKPAQLLNFWKRRWFRTLPNYYLILLVNILFLNQGWIYGQIEAVSYRFFIFTQNFAWPFTDFFWESWSLSIEEWFYIFLPIGFFVILRLAPNRKGLLAVILFMIVAPLCYRIAQSGEQVDAFWWDVKFRKVVLMRLDTIIYGVLAAYIKFYHEGFWRRVRWPAFLIGLVLLIGVEYIPKDLNGLFAKVFYFNVTTIGAMLILPLADSVQRFRTGLGKVWTHISLISYSMYLINLGLISQVFMRHFPPHGPRDGMAKYFLYWGLVVGISTLLYWFFEKPVMDLRDWKRRKVSP